MGYKTNSIEVIGKVKRIDVREGLSKNGADFISVTFTVDSNGNELRLESFAMKLSKAGELTGAFKNLDTLFKECKALHKTVKKVGEDKSEEIIDETIVENIEDADAIRFGNYGGFKWTRFEENVYAREGELVKNMRLTTQFPNRVDQEKVEYKPQSEFTITGKVVKAPVLLEREDETEYVKMSVLIPTYQSAYGNRSDSVTLHEINVEVRNPEAFDYVLSEFEMGSVAYLEGKLVRTVERVEQEVEVVDTGRGFGTCKHLNDTPKYQTKIDEAFVIEAGYPLEEDEIESMVEMNQDLWEEAMKVKKEKEEEMLNGGNEEKPKQGFGRGGSEVKKPKLPF